MAEDKTRRVHWLVMALQDPNVQFTTRSFMSFRLKYLGIAEAAAESLRLLEQDTSTPIRWYDEAFMRCSTAIVMSAFAMEAALNEAMMDLKVSETDLAGIDAERGPIARGEALAKHLGKQAPKRGGAVTQNADLLCKIRNALAHAKAEWSDEKKTHHNLSKRLNGRRLPRSPFSKPTDPAFPIACMSKGVAQWSVITARNYIAALYGVLGLLG